MASIAPPAATPQQSFTYGAPPLASSPTQQQQQHLSNQTHSGPSYGHTHGHPVGYSMSFGETSSQSSFPGNQPHPYPMPAYSRSFGDAYPPSRGYEGRPQIYTVWSFLSDSSAHRVALHVLTYVLGCLFRCISLRDGDQWYRLHAPTL